MIVAIEYPCFGPRFVLTLNMKNLTDWNLLLILESFYFPFLKLIRYQSLLKFLSK